MAKKHPVFFYKNCVSCGICAQACPISCLAMTNVRKQGKYIKPCPELAEEGCIGCGMCEKACPMDVITMEETADAG
ncbi:MAG: 4Fe-4S dicluster domain-containing protein [Eubacteriales bacterium]|nr:4Fe-4S dicluster domain-containing protein [Eubacteriales bacterium]